VQYFLGTALSPHIARGPQGFLIVRSARLARTAVREPQLYAGTELGLPTDGTVRVWREESEVFHPRFLASLEGAPVTNNHPSVFVNVENVGGLICGHAQNIRTIPPNGTEGFVVADLVIMNPILADEIERGDKRQLSVGYECLYQALPNGDFRQVDLKGNHIAVCREGRAGTAVRIQDAAKERTMDQEEKIVERRYQILMGRDRDRDDDDRPQSHDDATLARRFDDWCRTEDSESKVRAGLALLGDYVRRWMSKRKSSQDKRSLAQKLGDSSKDVERLMREGAGPWELNRHISAHAERVYDAKLVERFSGPSADDDFAKMVNARGRELRGDCRPSLTHRANDSAESWADSMNLAGKQMREK